MEMIKIGDEMINPKRIRIYPEWRACPGLILGGLCKLTVGLPHPNERPRFCKEIRDTCNPIPECKMGYRYNPDTEKGRWVTI